MSGRKGGWGRLAASAVATIGLVGALTGCASGKAEEYPQLVEQTNSTARANLPGIAAFLKADIVNARGITEYTGAEGINHVSYYVSATLTGPRPTQAQLEAAVAAAGYQHSPSDPRVNHDPIAFGDSAKKRITLSIQVARPQADDGAEIPISVTLLSTRQLSLSDAETKRLRELYSLEPVEFSLQK